MDITRIVGVMARFGYEVTRRDAEVAWEDMSDDNCASWLSLPESDDHLFRVIMPYFQQCEEPKTT